MRSFTLIELMLVILIMGILAAASVPIYRNYLAHAQLGSAIDLLLSNKTSVTSYLGSTRYPPTLSFTISRDGFYGLNGQPDPGWFLLNDNPSTGGEVGYFHMSIIGGSYPWAQNYAGWIYLHMYQDATAPRWTCEVYMVNGSTPLPCSWLPSWCIALSNCQ